MTTEKRVVFVSHGGGPLPLLGDPGHAEMITSLHKIVKEIPRPSAILVISAHWEASVATITSGSNPELIYDYFGFPAESYQIAYNCPGEPALAAKVQQALSHAKIPSSIDAKRGFDHGLFVPLKIMYPEADIPCVQLSLVNSLDAQTHIELGRALQALDYDNLLVLGSGFTFHNLRGFFHPAADQFTKSEAFSAWLIDTLKTDALSEQKRAQALANWESAPNARFCHPREEHLLPLHVCYGLAEKPCENIIAAKILDQPAGMFWW